MPLDLRRRRFGPIAPPPTTTVALPVGEALFLPRKLSVEEGERRGREAIQDGLLRPADSHTADIEAAQLVWLPVWRIDLEADWVRDNNVALRSDDFRARIRAAFPGGARHRGAVVLVGARKLLPFDITPSLELPLHAMRPRDIDAFDMGEVLDPDVSRDEALAEASARIRRMLRPSWGLDRDVTVRVRSVAHCHVPVWLRRYCYAGEALANSGEGAEECHVAISAYDGRVLSARHPSAVRALMGRVTRLIRRA